MKEHKILNKISQTEVFSFAGITRYKDVKIGKHKIRFIKNAKSIEMDVLTVNRKGLWDAFAYVILRKRVRLSTCYLNTPLYPTAPG